MKFIRNNGLSVAFFVLFILSFGGQLLAGYSHHNKELQEQAARTISIVQYIKSGHFIQATFENWESEFLQMALFVALTIWLKQKGSSESKSFDENEETDREPDPARKDAPWPVRKGGWILAVYKRSLTIALFLLFMISFIFHFYGSLKNENEESILHGLPTQTAGEYIWDSRFWFESFQNWQSEFLSIFAIIVLSIYLRQKGSSQSKPVDAPYSATGQ
jgi:hypothetical protein